MQTIILVGGKGERLRPLTNDRPKCMVIVNGKPIVEYQVEWLKRNGIRKITFACGYLHEVIKDYFKDGKEFGVEINYSIESEPLGRGGALKKAWSTIKSEESIVVTNGDVYSEIKLTDVINVHLTKKVKATVCLFNFKSPYGIVNFDGDSMVQKFEEKPILPYWINGGIYILSPTVKPILPDRGDHETTTFQYLVQNKKMYAFKSSSYWIGVDTVKDVNEFVSYLNR